MTEIWRLDGVDLDRLDRLASRIALNLKTGDVVTLSGPLGAGKTTLARTLVGHFDGQSEVPSPTFGLVQRYDTPRLALSHCDFYRLNEGELEELGLDDALADGALLIEWPERAAGWLPQDRLDIVLDETEKPARGDSYSRGAEIGRAGFTGCRRLRASSKGPRLPKPTLGTCREMRPRAAMRASCSPTGARFS